ncbi:hypothetical protein ACFLVB_03875 [Chloroflexota bacterium]
MKRYLIPIIIPILVSLLLFGCIGSPETETPTKAETTSIEISEPSFLYNISPEGVSNEQWYDHLEFNLGMHSGQAFPNEIFSPHWCVEISEISHPKRMTVGETVIITIKGTPDASLDLIFEYPIAGGGNRTERIDYVTISKGGTVAVPWLVSKDIPCTSSIESFVCLGIDAYPPLRAYYGKGHDWERMLVATHWNDCFFVYPGR